MSRPVDARGASPAVPDGDELLAKVPGDDLPVSAAVVADGFVVVVVPELGQPGVVVEVVVVVELELDPGVVVVVVDVVEVVELVEVVEVLVEDDVEEVVVVVDGQFGDVVDVVVVDASVDTADLSAGLGVTVQQGESTVAAARS